MYLLTILQIALVGAATGAVILRPAWFRTMVVVGAMGLAAIVGLNTRIFEYDGSLQGLDRFARSGKANSGIAAEECERILGFVDQLGLIGSIEDAQMPVKRDLWERLPENVQSAVTQCASLKYNAGRPLEILEQ